MVWKPERPNSIEYGRNDRTQSSCVVTPGGPTWELVKTGYSPLTFTPREDPTRQTRYERFRKKRETVVLVPSRGMSATGSRTRDSARRIGRVFRAHHTFSIFENDKFEDSKLPTNTNVKLHVVERTIFGCLFLFKTIDDTYFTCPTIIVYCLPPDVPVLYEDTSVLYIQPWIR